MFTIANTFTYELFAEQSYKHPLSIGLTTSHALHNCFVRTSVRVLLSKCNEHHLFSIHNQEKMNVTLIFLQHNLNNLGVKITIFVKNGKFECTFNKKW